MRALRPCVTCGSRRRAQRHNRKAPPKEGLRTAEQTPQRDGAARPAPGNGNKRQRPNPRPDLREGGGRKSEKQAGAQGLATQN